MAPKKKRCSALRCRSFKVPGDDRLMCPFPQPGSRQRMWVCLSGNEDLLKLTPMQNHRNRYMCPNHFTPDQFTNKFRIKLRLDAVPSVFEQPPLSDEIMQRYDQHFMTIEIIQIQIFIFNSDPENRCSQTPPHENDLLILPIDAPDDN
ncbi:THAP domain-containing protein 8, partial [Frankliniella fusca]